MQEHWYVEVPEIWSSSHLLPNIYKSVLWSHPQHLHVPLHVSSYKLVEKRDLWDSCLTSHHALTTVKSQWSILLNTKKHFKRKKNICRNRKSWYCVCVYICVREACVYVCLYVWYPCVPKRKEWVCIFHIFHCFSNTFCLPFQVPSLPDADM